jgi:hypothetical protein
MHRAQQGPHLTLASLAPGEVAGAQDLCQSAGIRALQLNLSLDAHIPL